MTAMIKGAAGAKFRSCCAWEPKIPLAASLREMLESWRIRLTAAPFPGLRQEVALFHHSGCQNESISTNARSV